MKRRLFTKLTSLAVTAAIFMSFTSLIHADVTEDEGDPQDIAAEEFRFEETVIPDADFDNDALAAQYINMRMSGSSEAVNRKFDFADELNEYEQKAFNYIVPVLADIAAGRQTSAEISIPADVLTISFSNTDLGVEDFSTLSVAEIQTLAADNLPINSKKIMNALLFACPYDLYWFNKTTGMGMGYSISRGKSTLSLKLFSFSFYVAVEYQGGNDLEVSSAYGEAVSAAASNANSIISRYAGLGDYDKLLAYNNEICKLTDYNHPAAGGGAAYGNPWQIVWVFDGDPETKVVCEGYAKAFQYLCDNSVFRYSDLYAISVSGYLDGEGHMWNIVHMNDGRNYAVDVTNSDPGGENNCGHSMFLIGAESGSASSGYLLRRRTQTFMFVYKDFTLDFYGEAQLTLSSENYNPEKEYSLTLLPVQNGTAELSKYSAKPGDEISVEYSAPTGWKLDQILVNGEAVNSDKFNMPSMDVTVEVTFVKADYSITVNAGEGGTAGADKTSANYGDEITLTLTPNTGYKVGTITVNEQAINGTSFEMPAEDVTVEVTFVKVDYSITVNAGEGGTAGADKTSANYGDEITLTVTPNTGYKVGTITVNEQTINGTSFDMPDADVTVEVTFVKVDYSITVNAGEGGTAGVDKNSANYGDEITLTVTPNTGYKVGAITVNDTLFDGSSFVMPAEDVTVEVTFVKVDYTITVNAGEGGTAGADKTSANYGDEITLTVTPDTGYEIDTITVNEQTIDGTSFEMPAGNVTVAVTFRKSIYTISITNTSGGTANITQTTANYGDEIVVDIAIEEGYHLESILVNDVEIDGTSFSMPAGNVNVEVIFKKNEYTITVEDTSGGTAAVSSAAAVPGAEVTVTATPDKGYVLESIMVNGEVIKGNKFAMPDCEVTVKVIFKKCIYKISVNTSTTGTAVVSKTKANYGDEITVETTPDNGYKLSKIAVKTAGGDTVKVTGNTFIMPDEDVTVNVTFAKISYQIVCEETQNGMISVVASAKMGNHITVVATPDEGYEFAGMIVADSDGNEITVTDNTFTMPASPVTITASFKKIDYTITLICSDNGTAEVSKNPANIGDEITVTASPAEGYELSTIKVDGELIEGNTFTMPAADVSVVVTFKEKEVVKNGWILEEGNYYYYEDGNMVTGWLVSGSKYYLDPETGIMVTGWQKIGTSWYYFTGSGAMVTGWKELGGKWYLFDADGIMATGWRQSGNKWYYFTGSGDMVTGWKEISGKWYFFENSGAMFTGWKQSGGKWYYLAGSGAMVTGWKEISSKWYYFDANGVMLTGWKQSGSTWYYLDAGSGAMVTGWKSISGKWYYFYDNGAMACSTTIDGYTLGADGAWTGN